MLLQLRKRQNLLLASNDPSNAAWTKTRTAAATDVVVAPDGVTLAYEVSDSVTDNNTHFIQQTVTGGMYGTVTIGCFLKDAERTSCVLRISDATQSATVATMTANLSANTVSIPNAAHRGGMIVLPNDWHLIWVSGPNTTNDAVFRLYPSLSTAYAGTVGSGVYMHAPFMVRGARVPTLHVRRA